MKRLLAVSIFASVTILVIGKTIDHIEAQQTNTFLNGLIQSGTGGSGACTIGRLYIHLTTGVIYNCPSSSQVWTPISNERIVCQNLTNPTDAATQNQWNTMTCAIPANTLVTNGDRLTVKIPSLLASNTNAKEYQTWWALSTATCSGSNSDLCDSGCKLISSNTSSSGVGNVGEIDVFKTGSATQKYAGHYITSTSIQSNSVSSTCTVNEAAATQITAGWRNTAAAAASVNHATLDVRLSPR